MATANIKITALSDITSANMTYNDLVAVVDMNGTPETKKANIQLVGNLILNGAGGSYFPAAAQAILAQSVTNAAQPNITSVGTLSSLAVTANVTAGNVSVSGTVNGVLVGEGGNISNVQVGNVAGLGNIATINLDGNVSNVFRGDGTFGPEGAGGNANYANFAGTAYAVDGANVSGEVGFAAVANSVALANVSGAGNIASINLDGNVSNVLRGDGTWDSDANSTYGDANVVSLLGAFGSNTIVTTGDVELGNANVQTINVDGFINGDGFGISNVPYANITGTPTLGNVSTINLDGNASNILHGDGTWSADATDYSNANVVSLLASFGSNTISTTGLITGDAGGLSNVIGANVTGAVSNASLASAVTFITSSDSTEYSLVFTTAGAGNKTPRVDSAANLTYNPSTNKLTVSGNIESAGIFEGDGGGLSNIVAANISGVVANATYAADAGNASLATIANTAIVAYGVDLANVVGAGNIASINLDGNVSNVLRGDGTFGADANSSYGDSNVTSLLSAFGSNTISTTGNVDFGNVFANTGSMSALNFIATSGNVDTLTGIFNGDGGGLSNIAVANVTGLGNIATTNLDGNVSNVLAGDGTWIAAGSGGTYGDANVVTLLSGFGTNSISTTGNGVFGNVFANSGVVQGQTANFGLIAGALTSPSQANITEVGTLGYLNVTGNIDSLSGIFNGDGYGLSNIAYANITGTPSLGNISTINLDGNVSNVLRGDGTFAADANSSYGDSNVTSLLASFGGNAISTTANISAGNINANTNGFSLGYLEIPQVSLTADDTIALEDSGKHFHSNTAGNITLTIPTNATVAFPVGTAINIVEEAAGNILVNAAAGVSLYLAGNSTAANRVLGSYGMATIMKTGTDTWFINGTGVS